MFNTGDSEPHGRNTFWTPTNISTTKALISDAMKNISVEGNSDSLFEVNNNVIEPIESLPIKTTNFIITATDEEIDENETNAVNKRYLKSKVDDLDLKFLTMNNSTNTRRIVWDGYTLAIQSRANSSASWTNKIRFEPNTPSSASSICVQSLYINSSASTSGNGVSSILTSSTSAISSSNTAIATGGYVDNYYLSKTGTAANASKIEWTYNNNTNVLVPNQNVLQLKKGNDVNGYLSTAGNAVLNYIYPAARIVFGKKIDSTGAGIETDSNKWISNLVNIANSTYYANRSSTPYSSVSDLDTLVPSFKVLDDNYLTMNNSTDLRRIRWDGYLLALQSRAQTTDSWTNKALLCANGISNPSYIAIGKIFINANGSNSSDYVDSILTSSTSAISSSNTAIATGGYLNQYYLSMNNADNLRRIVWDGNVLYLQTRADTTADWINKIRLNPNSTSGNASLCVKTIFLNNSASATGDYVTSILTSSTSAKSTSNYAIATGGYVDTYYYDKTTSDARYLGVNGTAKCSDKLTYIVNVLSDEPYKTTTLNIGGNDTWGSSNLLGTYQVTGGETLNLDIKIHLKGTNQKAVYDSSTFEVIAQSSSFSTSLSPLTQTYYVGSGGYYKDLSFTGTYTAESSATQVKFYIIGKTDSSGSYSANIKYDDESHPSFINISYQKSGAEFALKSELPSQQMTMIDYVNNNTDSWTVTTWGSHSVLRKTIQFAGSNLEANTWYDLDLHGSLHVPSYCTVSKFCFNMTNGETLPGIITPKILDNGNDYYFTCRNRFLSGSDAITNCYIYMEYSTSTAITSSDASPHLYYSLMKLNI